MSWFLYGYDETEDVDNILELAEKKVFDLSQNKSTKGYSSIKDVLVSSLTEIEKLYNQKGRDYQQLRWNAC